MRRLFISMIMIILLSGYISYVFAEEMMSDKDRAKFGLAMSLTTLKKYDEALKILKELHKAFPDDKMVDIELTNSLYEAGLTKANRKGPTSDFRIYRSMIFIVTMLS